MPAILVISNNDGGKCFHYFYVINQALDKMDRVKTQTTTFSDSKSHYQILDALRGIAALTVVAFHLLETFTNGDHSKQIINHGYLAVDFFFVLSGFVIGHAYDDRWGKMTLGGFFKRRLIRLHPMIIVGMTIGAIAFYFQAAPSVFPNISATPVWKMILVMLIGYTLIPVPQSLDIRGWGEMHPLNGPAWSLFFEYIANILYALFVRRFSNTVLAVLVFLAGGLLIHMAVTSPNGDVIGGWSLEPAQFRIGITRLMYPFFAGLLVSRLFKPGHINNAFLWCGLLLLTVLAFPRVGTADQLWINGLYDSLSIIFLFPLIVYLGASGTVKGKSSLRLSRFLGDISYPIYIIHYPLIYMYTAWVANHHPSLPQAFAVGVAAFFAAILIAYGCLKLYDIPVRKWLTQRYMPAKAT
ncbi:MAG TPA: acyltransferase, partial [Flavisolibacter sp.]|nr:acyltransferase [Flavisolibacter sp.]